MSEIGSASWRAQVEAVNNAAENNPNWSRIYGGTGQLTSGYARPLPEPTDLSTPAKVLDAHLAGLRDEVKTSAICVAKAKERLAEAEKVYAADLKALTDFEAEMKGR